MIGMREYGDRLEGLQDGEQVSVIVTGIGPIAAYKEQMLKDYELAKQKAAALGLPEPGIPDIDWKKAPLMVELAVTGRSNGRELISEKVCTVVEGAAKIPPYICTTNITQRPLPEVFELSENLRKNGKSYGYNFQRRGVVGARVKEGELILSFGYLHANPNPEKDWGTGVHAYQVDSGDEKYRDLMQKEQERLDTWQRDIAAWNELTSDEAKAELLEGISRRLCLVLPGNPIKYVKPVIGLQFECKIAVREKGYFDLVAYSDVRQDGKTTYNVHTKNVLIPTDEEVAFAQEIALGITQKRMARLAEQNTKGGPLVNDVDPF